MIVSSMERVRPPAVAGQFYAQDPEALRAQVEGCLEPEAPRPVAPPAGRDSDRVGAGEGAPGGLACPRGGRAGARPRALARGPDPIPRTAPSRDPDRPRAPGIGTS